MLKVIVSFRLLVSFQTAFVLSETSDFDYCTISKAHTYCMYKTISKNCVQYKTENEAVVRRILNDHNTARSQFAGGHKGFFVPNMMKMYWDQELADLSSRWACQCKGSLDADRGVERFEVGQIVWTMLHPDKFTPWNDIWRYILQGGTGFFHRDLWGKMITNYEPSDPLSLIYNPTVRFVGCTLARHLTWSVEILNFVKTTTLVCNYGPVKDSYDKYPKEDWPCRDCPEGFPCFTKFYMRGNIMPPNLPNERNLCIDPQLEYQHPRPGEQCPVELPGSRRMRPEVARKNPCEGKDITQCQTGRIITISKRTETTHIWTFESTSVSATTEPSIGTSTELPSTSAQTNFTYLPSSTDQASFTYLPSSTDEATFTYLPSSTDQATFSNQPSTTDLPSSSYQLSTAKITEEPSTETMTTPTATSHEATTQEETNDIVPGGHDPSEEDYDYHGAMDGDGYINYCELGCSTGDTHTLCAYETTAPVCGQFNSLTNNMTVDDLLHLHNEFRNKYAEGATKPLHPLASNMVRLRWSTKLTRSADMWLRQCEMKHDDCRDEFLTLPSHRAQRMYKVSQNIKWKYYNLNETCPSHRDLFHLWLKEAYNFTFNDTTYYYLYTPDNRMNEDFVQVIWARTHYIGCAYGSFTLNSTTTGVAMLVCNYAPVGKEAGKYVYIPGGPCSNCFTQTDLYRGRCFSRKYPNLCDSGNELLGPPKFVSIFSFIVMLLSIECCFAS